MQVHKEYNTNNNIHSSSLLYNFTLYNAEFKFQMQRNSY